MSETDFYAITINLIITVFCYLLIPVIVRLMYKNGIEKSEAREVAIINAIMVYLLFTLYYIFLTDTPKVANVLPAFLWGGVSYYIMKEKDNHTNNEEETKKDGSDIDIEKKE